MIKQEIICSICENEDKFLSEYIEDIEKYENGEKNYICQFCECIHLQDENKIYINTVYKNNKTGNLYEIVYIHRHKQIDKWSIAVVYSPKKYNEHGHIYSR